MMFSRTGSFGARHLDVGARMGELLFGLIMTLTFTLGAGFVIEEEGRQGARDMLVAILGCNLAWGIIDGALYVLGQVFERGRLRRIGALIRDSASPAEARQYVAAEWDEVLGPVTDEPVRQQVYAAVVERLRQKPLGPNRVRRDDVMGGIASGWIVFACSFPAALPFLFLDEPRLALRISNGILLALLFAAGYYAARNTLAKPWLSGAVFLLAGAFLVVLAIALGG
jgi:hypothetical protein